MVVHRIPRSFLKRRNSRFNDFSQMPFIIYFGEGDQWNLFMLSNLIKFGKRNCKTVAYLLQ